MTTRIPTTPLRQNFLNTDGSINRQSMMFLQQRVPQIYRWQFVVYDSTPGNNNNISGPQYVYIESWLPQQPKIGTGRRIVAMLLVTITADLVVRVNNITKGYGMTSTIGKATPILTPVVLDISTQSFSDLDVLTFDVLASDSQIVGSGVAAYGVEWTGII